ncbi:hypothetical protein LCGC14_1793100, partial [marine sediment metagenome]
EDTTNPVITVSPNNFTVEYGYTGQSLSWNATDPNPNTYTIELQGSGIVAGPTAWTSGVPIMYNILDGFAVGVYVYTVNFTDDYGNSITDSVTFTVGDMANPTIINAPSNLTVEFGYTGLNLSWNATDPNPNTYTIELQGSGIVAGPTAWTSGVTITYNIPDGFAVGVYVYTINFTDDYGNSIIDSITFTVEDTTNPVITVSPNNFTVEYGYTGQSLSWNATDPNPNTYTIELQGSGIVAGPTAWTSGVTITYNIPDGFAVGVYVYTVNFTDDYGNSIVGNVTFTIDDTTNPTIISAPSDLTVEFGYTGQNLSWNATDPHPNTYTIELQGSGIVAGPNAWTSGVTITYNIPDGFAVGVYVYTVNFTDDYGNSIIGNVTFTIDDTTNPTIIINNPTSYQLFGPTAPSGVDLNVDISDGNLQASWYQLIGTITTNNFTWTGVINQSAWDLVGNGTVTFKVYAKDSVGNEDFDYVIIRKDIIVPIITINSPIINELYSDDPPNFNVLIFDINGIDSMWYGIVGKSMNVIFTSNGSIDQTLWNTIGNGFIIIRFYANDTLGNQNYEDVVIEKDIIAPIIKINSPNLNDEFVTSAPAYDISINESHLDQIWYTLDGGITNISITFLSGAIDQIVWDGVSLGAVTITFYANDTLGNIGFMSVGVAKIINGGGEPSEPPDLLRTIAAILSIIVGTFSILGIFYKTIYTGKIKPKKWAKKLKSSGDEEIRFYAASKLKKSKSNNSAVISALKKAANDSSEKIEIRNLAKEALEERGIFVND